MLYDTGARVSELVNIKVCDVILENQPVIILNGKGMKVRRVPLMQNTVELLKSYISENSLNQQWKKQYPLFTNKQHSKLTKEGISYILNKYVQLARLESTIIPAHAAPHMLRHSKE